MNSNMQRHTKKKVRVLFVARYPCNCFCHISHREASYACIRDKQIISGLETCELSKRPLKKKRKNPKFGDTRCRRSTQIRHPLPAAMKRVPSLKSYSPFDLSFGISVIATHMINKFLTWFLFSFHSREHNENQLARYKMKSKFILTIVIPSAGQTFTPSSVHLVPGPFLSATEKLVVIWLFAIVVVVVSRKACASEVNTIWFAQQQKQIGIFIRCQVTTAIAVKQIFPCIAFAPRALQIIPWTFGLIVSAEQTIDHRRCLVVWWRVDQICCIRCVRFDVVLQMAEAQLSCWWRGHSGRRWCWIINTVICCVGEYTGRRWHDRKQNPKVNGRHSHTVDGDVPSWHCHWCFRSIRESKSQKCK